MDWKAANEQKEIALLRVFFMFVVMFLLTIQTGREARGASVCFPFEDAPQGDAQMHGTRQFSDADHRREVLTLLCAMEVVAQQLFGLMMRQAHELANQPPAFPTREQACGSVSQLTRTAELIDTS